MGDCPPSGCVAWAEDERSSVTVEYWDAGYPDPGDEPRINITVEDYAYKNFATGGLTRALAAELRDSLSRWLEANRRSPRKDRN